MAKPARKNKPRPAPSPAAEEILPLQAARRVAEHAAANAACVLGPLVPDYSPLTHELRVVDGRLRIVRRVRDGLDRMRESGTIDDRAFAIARLFQDAFDLASRDDLRAIDLNATGGGSLGREEFVSYRMAAVDSIRAYYEVLGGETAVGARALRYIIGQRVTLDQLVAEFGHPHHFWRGALVAALSTLVAHEEGKKSGRLRVDRMGLDSCT